LEAINVLKRSFLTYKLIFVICGPWANNLLWLWFATNGTK